MNRLFSLLQRHPYVIAIFLAIITAYSAWYGQRNFEVNADLSSLVKQEGEWVDNLTQINETFPNTGNVLVLISSETSDESVAASQYAMELEQAFRQEPIFTDVFAPSSLPWFDEYALGFVSQDDFARLLSQFEHQLAPAILAARMQSVEQYFALLADRAEHTEQPLEPILQASQQQEVDWQQLLKQVVSPPQHYVVTLTAEPDNSQKNPNQQVISKLERILSRIERPDGVTVEFTGQTPLDYDEIKDANDSIALAGTASLIGLLLILTIGIRSLRVIVACYVTVLIGLTWTFAAGLAVVGHYSTISIVFMVMFIGLAVDFAIHLCLHIQELRAGGEDNQQSLKHALTHSFRPLGLCALSSAIGFMSFYPTAYTGLGELGVISAMGMVLGLVATFTVIPLFFELFGYPTVRHSAQHGFGKRYATFIYRWQKHIVATALGLFVVMGIGASQFKFDFSTLVLKNPQSESVLSLNRLQELGLGSSYQLYAVADDEEQAQAWQHELRELDMVSSVTIANDFLPHQWVTRQNAVVDTISSVTPAAPMAYQQFKALAQEQNWPQAEQLPETFEPQNSAYLFSGTQMFAESLSPQPAPEISDIPSELLNRYVSDDKRYLVTIVPQGDMTNVDSVQRFIREVQAITPNATGRAVAEQQVGKIIVNAFQTAIIIAVVAITLLLTTTIRSAKDIALIFVPLTLASLTTLGMMHWFNLSMNMANIIVIPLIFGLGVDNGIHIVNRFRAVGDIHSFFATSTPKATVVSCLSTLMTFGALILAQHQGMHSIGLVLTIALSSILVYSLVLLPVSLQLTISKKS
ncbi:efflux RND transporter permease subunit [Vibrio agarivorans]|uniref:efflux RND transporter permease subunit n=1 Tax=Vibrio agarivorans TaxID=153622 RepID=UPI00222E0F5E|nr:efflux RND transporter permease subunit [Vibrio agarivorans]MDN3663174.1 efflux RND transporter permease subunit [Vibrio agarivorans]